MNRLRINVVLDGKLAGVVKDINHDGMTFFTPKILEQGKKIQASLLMPGMVRAVEVNGLVLECTAGEGAEIGFIDLATDSFGGLDSIIKKFNEAKNAFNDGGKKKILLVDDSASARNIYKLRLMLDGYEVTAVASALDAMAYLRDETPDLVLLDVVMPVMDGFKLLKIIRETPKLLNIPVMILSARGASVEIETAFVLGISGYLVKTTTSPNKLSEEIKIFFSRAAWRSDESKVKPSK